MTSWYRVRPLQAPPGARRLWVHPVSFATTGNAVIAYPDGRAYLGETIRHVNTHGKRETWIEAFVLSGDKPCPAPDNWREYILEEIEKPS